MSRPLVLLAAALFVLLGLAPLALMAARVTPEDLSALFTSDAAPLLGRTALYGLGVAALALLLGVPFGFLTARTDMPLASVLRPLGVVPLFLPPMMLAMVWTAVAQMRGAPAAYFVSALSTFPLVAVFAARAFERIDARLEDAARLVGGTRAVLRATLPLALPPALCGACLAFVFTINDFSVPDYVSWLGLPKFSVYADSIYATWRIDARAGRAVAMALPLFALTLLTLVPALALRRRGALASVVPDFRSSAPIALGPWRWPAFVFCAGLLAVGAFIPLGRLLWEAGGGHKGWSFGELATAFSMALERSRGDVRNSVVSALATASACVVLGLVLGHALERSRRARALEPWLVLPLAVPAVLFGIGIVVLWNRDATAALYDSNALVAVLLTGRFVVFAALISSGAVAALDPSLEDAARMAGVGPPRRLACIVAPALRSSLAGGFVLVFVLSLRELDATLFVPAANHTAMFRIFNQIHFGRDGFVAALALLLVFLIVLPGLLWSLFARKRLELLP
ncbi:MAG: iron ABC transporter permease [Planctomycetes bacterium]|nr:iron ABC transporter permease [Planctomycetota bacterium]